jgi:ParB family chromosome partitioning protein
MKIKQYGEMLPVKTIRVSPYHFRKETAQEKLEDLAASIKELGLIHAVSVVVGPDGGPELINGHRRLLAHKLGKISTIRANVYQYEPDELADESRRQQAIVQFLLAANSAEPLVPIERARYYEEAMDKFGWDPEDIARVHHVTVESVYDDMMFLNLDPRVLDMVQVHPDSFTQENLRVLARYATPSEKKAWAITSEEQIQVAEALALQKDKKLVESSRALDMHIKDIVKRRRDEAAAARRRLGSTGDDPVKALFKLIDNVRRATDSLTRADLVQIKSIEPKDKGAAYQELLGMAQTLIDFADDRVQHLKATSGAKATTKRRGA